MADASQRLKALQTKLKEAVDKHYDKKTELRAAMQAETDAANAVQFVRNEIELLKIRERDVIFTEHAFVRFFERVLGYSLEKVKEEMLPQLYRDRIAGRSYSEVRVGNSHIAVVKDGKVITVYEPDPEPPKIRQIKDDDSALWDTAEVGVTDEDGESGRGADL